MKSYPHISLRLSLAPETLLGAGKAALLQGIAETGSISAASRAMDMSYKRAWYLIDTLNGSFAEPLVVSVKGGRTGGGASLTETGRTVLALYRRLENTVRTAAADDLAELAELAKTAEV